MAQEMSGGCQCGRIRYVATIDAASEAYLCHCRMCRRATGGASIAFVQVPLDKVRFETEPDWYASSPIAVRPFCSRCGTPLGFRFAEGAKGMDLTLGSFDEPEGFVPAHNYAVESMLPAWADCSHLPGIRSEDNASVVDRWMKAVGKLPD